MVGLGGDGASSLRSGREGRGGAGPHGWAAMAPGAVQRRTIRAVAPRLAPLTAWHPPMPASGLPGTSSRRERGVPPASGALLRQMCGCDGCADLWRRFRAWSFAPPPFDLALCCTGLERVQSRPFQPCPCSRCIGRCGALPAHARLHSCVCAPVAPSSLTQRMAQRMAPRLANGNCTAPADA